MSARTGDGRIARSAATGAGAARLALAGTSILLTGSLLAMRLPLLSTRRFDPDELEHAHVAWSLVQGAVPYRDFFEHHTPLFHYALAGLLSPLHPEQSADAAMHALVMARTFAWALSVVVVALTFLYARRLRDTTTAWVAMPIAAGSIVMALRAIEIRPDGLSTTLWLTSLLMLYGAIVRRAPASAAARWRFAGAGLAFGLATLTSQKLLLAGPPLALVGAWYLISANGGGSTRDRVMALLWFGAGAAAMWLAVTAAFAAAGAGGSFLHRTVFESLRWKSENRATTLLAFVLKYEPWLFAMTAAGAAVLIDRVRRGLDDAAGAVLLLVPSVGMFLGLFIMPVPYAQYCLTFLPLFAIVSACGLVEGARALAASDGPLGAALSIGGGLAAMAVIALAVVGLSIARPVVVTPIAYPVMIAIVIAAALALPRYRLPEAALTVALIALAVLPLQWTRWLSVLGDEGQFAEIRFVLDHTSPGEIVMDGWSGSGVFRRHAAYYWMLHPGVRAMLTPDDVRRIVTPIVEGSVRPAIVVLDDNLRQLSPELTAFVEREYRPAGVGRVRVRVSR